ncbi:D-glycero-beta-D-manno-heptose-7-phosphate kinase [Bradyrhizobium macuxiense]|uniref:D-glycero-beta-D-manno-heptose-7-phosphate kinase n=1 Tax=Bradyrhizobium macuxiense TaxID=1755647 RepID=UPI001FEDAEBE|nr:D-glycero-beta-D-manno-heptose-7-phosphate kinase [Bradyrhizobium macuxiense]
MARLARTNRPVGLADLSDHCKEVASDIMYFDFSGLRITVVGDLILDRYLEGLVKRLSPEAPVAVLLQQSERDVLGGAANVAANLSALGAKTDLVGVVGADGTGARLLDMLERLVGVRTDIVVDKDRPTTCKTRVASGAHQIVRIDHELSNFVQVETEADLVGAARNAAEQADVVVLSDYAKGACSDRVIRETIECATRAGRPSIVDPKRHSLEIYRGATLITPNRDELMNAVRMPCETDAEVERAGKRAIEHTGASILLTRSEQGLSFFSPDGHVLHLPTATQDVFDVSGAGDTVLAVTALGYGANLPVSQIMRLANTAAGIVVGKVGTAVVTLPELYAALEKQMGSPRGERGGLVTLHQALDQRERWRRQGLTVGFTNGCFDLLHSGHAVLLSKAAEACDKLIVAINSDASVKRLKGPSRPIQTEESRAHLLGEMRMVDLVVSFQDDTPIRLVEALQPDVLVKGADYTEDQVVGSEFVKALGGKVVLVPLMPHQSTSSLIRRGLGGIVSNAAGSET